MELTEVKQAIQKWESIRNSADQVTAYLKNGSYVIVNRQQFEVWNILNPAELHVHMGIFGDELKFILIDSESSKNIVANQGNLFIQSYVAGTELLDGGFIDNATNGGITVFEALKRITLWNTNLDVWVKQQVDSEHGIFKSFVIPFSNLTNHFEVAGAEESMLVFGLKNNVADLMLWGLKTSANTKESEVQMSAMAFTDTPEPDGIPVEDFSYPCPPGNLNPNF